MPAADREGGARLQPASMAVSLGRPGAAGDPLSAPVAFTATYRADGERTYGRDSNPSWDGLESVVGALEGGHARAFASGLAAVAAVIEDLRSGAVVVAPADAYNGTRRLLLDLESRGRLEVRLVDQADAAAVETALSGASLLWLESPTNPLLAVVDLAPLIEAGHRVGATVAVDNTFATPLRQCPLALGADFVVHSATKLLAGHSDVVMGVAVAATTEGAEALTRRRSLHGAIPGPMEAFLALRGVRTLAVRLDRAETNAAELAARLRGRADVSVVRYPGFGTMVSFDMAGGASAADAVCAAIQLLVPATSLGGVETLIERRGKWANESHLPPGLLRMSVGIEDVEDLWSDLDQALRASA